MSGSQKKKAEKARRQAERDKAHQAERRRNVLTGIVVGVIVLLGGLLVFLSLDGGDDVELAASESAEALTSELMASVSEAAGLSSEGASEDPSGEPTAGPTDVVPADPEVEPGVPVNSSEETITDDRPVACDAEAPSNAGDVRPQYPGGPAQVLEDGVDYSAVIQTSCGTITMDLLEGETPQTVNSFVFLAQVGFFDGLEIFRNATSISALQTGGGNQTNSWQIGYSLPDELGVAETGGYPEGAVAMANAGPNSGGSQFFFVYGDGFQTALDGGGLGPTFAVFGQITDGLDIAQQIGEIPTGGDQGETPDERVYMESVTIQGN